MARGLEIAAAQFGKGLTQVLLNKMQREQKLADLETQRREKKIETAEELRFKMSLERRRERFTTERDIRSQEALERRVRIQQTGMMARKQVDITAAKEKRQVDATIKAQQGLESLSETVAEAGAKYGLYDIPEFNKMYSSVQSALQTSKIQGTFPKFDVQEFQYRMGSIIADAKQRQAEQKALEDRAKQEEKREYAESKLSKSRVQWEGDSYTNKEFRTVVAESKNLFDTINTVIDGGEGESFYYDSKNPDPIMQSVLQKKIVETEEKQLPIVSYEEYVEEAGGYAMFLQTFERRHQDWLNKKELLERKPSIKEVREQDESLVNNLFGGLGIFNEIETGKFIEDIPNLPDATRQLILDRDPQVLDEMRSENLDIEKIITALEGK